MLLTIYINDATLLMVLVDNRFATMKVCNIKLTVYFKHDLFIKRNLVKKKFKEGPCIKLI